jgi:glutamyl-Q tRNA(Asp) synthetase
MSSGPVFRFAPSPNGELHLGHALSALMNFDMARETGGRLLLRIEDIDPARCRPEYKAQIYEDLRWLGLEWEEPVRRQSEHIAEYQTALDALKARGLVYPAFLSRAEVKSHVEAYEKNCGRWRYDPDGSPHYPIGERELDPVEAAARIASGDRHMWRLNVERALAALYSVRLSWTETGTGDPQDIPVNPVLWGDVVLWRWDAPSSYHLSVVLDDALQGVTHVVRGMDLFHATHVHRLLQALTGMPAPIYHHHALIRDEAGQKLAKSIASTGLRELREAGETPSGIRRRLGLLAA